MPKLVKEYVETGKVRLVWHDFAWIGNESRLAAQAARCAGRQSKFWEYHDLLFARQRGENEGQFSPSNLNRFASELGLDAGAFGECLSKAEDAKAIQDDLGAARARGIRGTPGFTIGTQTLFGANEAALRSALEAAVARG